MDKLVTDRERISLNFICQIYNSKEFKSLFGKSQLYTVHNASEVDELDDKMELGELIRATEEFKVAIDLLQHNGYRMSKDKVPKPKSFSQLIAYSLTNIAQEDFQMMAGDFLERIHSKIETTDRGIHSVDVAIINGLIAKRLKEPDIALTIAMGLAHDIGHTPFGHEVEEAIDVLITDVYREHFPDKLEKRIEDMKAQEEKTSEGEKRTQKSNLFFSHERNGAIKFEDLMSLYEAKFFEELGTNDVPYNEKTIMQYEKMKVQIKSSILAHTTSRMSKRDLKREQLVNGGIVEITRISDKVAYTISDLNDILRKGNATPAEIQRCTQKIATEYMMEYCQKKNKQVSEKEVQAMLDNFSSLTSREQVMYMVDHTYEGDNYVKMNPVVWRMSKAYRKTVAKVREQVDFNKNTKAIYAVGYLNWESEFLKKYSNKLEMDGDLTEEELRQIVDETNEVVCRRKDREALNVARKVMNDIGYDSEKTEKGQGVNDKRAEDALHDTYER